MREKAAAEGARAVVIVHDVTAKHLTIFGVMDESRATASIDYVFNTPKKTVDRWDIEWQPVENDT